MTKIKNNLRDLINEISEEEDQTQAVESTDFEFQPPAEGVTVGRLIEYIELGQQPMRPYKGKEKPPADKVRIVFELLSPKKNIREIEVEGKGKVKVADRIVINTKKSLHENSGFFKLFNKMRYGRDDIKHMAQMLGEAFILTVVHNVVGEGKDKRTYANITNDAGEYLISAPFKVDPIEETKTPIPVPEAISELRLFLFNKPTQETWDSLFVDGEREVDDGKGGKKQVSKNKLQETILGAVNFEGSALAELLEGSDALPEEMADLEDEAETESNTDDALSELLGEAEDADDTSVEEEAPKAKAPAKKSTTTAKAATKSSADTTATKKAAATTAKKSPSKEAAPAKKAPAKKAEAPTEEEDPLAALGLDQ